MRISRRGDVAPFIVMDVMEQARTDEASGRDFDPIRGHTTLRFSYAGSSKDMIEGIRRLIAWRGAR